VEDPKHSFDFDIWGVKGRAQGLFGIIAAWTLAIAVLLLIGWAAINGLALPFR
jgi:hypothetical protein